MKINEAMNLIENLYHIQVTTGIRYSVEIVSGPGLGKSSMLKQLAKRMSKKMQRPFFFKPFFLTTLERCDVIGYGLPGKDREGNLIMQFSRAPWMPSIDEGDHGFLLLDEYGQADNDVKKPSAELLLNGAVGESKLPITVMVVMASNRQQDRSGVGKSMAFLDNRKMTIEIQPDLDAWVEWAETEGIEPWTIAFAKVKPGTVFRDSVPDKPGPFCTPRTLVQMSYLVGKLPMDLFLEAAGGYIGQGAAAEFVSFLRVAEQLPKYEEIVANPEKCRLPEVSRPDAQYATMQMIAHRVDGKTAAPAFKYLTRMPQEFQVAGLKATLRRCPEIVQTTDFANWLKANKDLVMSANILSKKN